MKQPSIGHLLPVLAALLACGQAPPPPTPLAVGPADDQVAAVFSAAFEADARIETADSLYEPSAVVVADGVSRHAPPRFAGVGAGGAIAVTSSLVEVRSGVAWAQIVYQWISTSAGIAREGRATVVLVQNEQGAWRIRHAHSSSPTR